MRIPHQIVDLLLKGDDENASLMLDTDWVNIHDDDGKTLLIHSIENNCPKMFDTLLHHGANCNLTELSTQRSPLMFACMKGENDFLPRLLEIDGIDVQLSDTEGNSAFFYAAFWGNLSALILLMNKVPELAHKANRKDEIPIEYTIREHRPEAFSLFLEMDDLPKDKWADLIHLSAEMDTWPQAAALIAKYPPAKDQFKEGFLPVHRAVISGNLPWLKEALESEMYSVNLPDSFENTPLHYAAALGFPEIVRMLLDNGADKTLKNNEDKSPQDYVSDEAISELLM